MRFRVTRKLAIVMCLDCRAWVVGGGGGGGGGERERERLPVEETGTVVEKYCLKNEQQCIIRFLNLTIHDYDCEVFERL